MNERRFVLLIVAAILGLGCGPTQTDPSASESETGGSTSSTSSSSSTASTSSGGEHGESSSSSTSSSGSDVGETSSSCEDWSAGDPEPPSSWQDCLTDECPEGEVCRYDPERGCDAHPVCINSNRTVCICEIYGPAGAGFACPCPDYTGPLNEFGYAPLECNTAANAAPVTSDDDCLI